MSKSFEDVALFLFYEAVKASQRNELHNEMASVMEKPQVMANFDLWATVTSCNVTRGEEEPMDEVFSDSVLMSLVLDTI